MGSPEACGKRSQRQQNQDVTILCTRSWESVRETKPGSDSLEPPATLLIFHTPESADDSSSALLSPASFPDSETAGVEADFSEGNAWWAHQDLNLEPTDYESAALTN